MWHERDRREMHTRFWWGNLTETPLGRPKLRWDTWVISLIIHKVAKLRSRWCNPSESYGSYSRALKEAACAFVTSLAYTVWKWRVLDIASAGASGAVTAEDQRSYIKFETLRGTNPKEIQNSKSFETLGRHHWEAGGLHGRIVIRHFLK
jgi:hypothetical protein